MRTVKNLIEELQKFPEDAACHAYEGEDTGITIVGYGFIYLSGSLIYKDKETEIFTNQEETK